MLGLMFAVSSMLNDRLLPELEHQLNNLLVKLHINTSILDREKNEMENAQTFYWNVRGKINAVLQPIYKQLDETFNKWVGGYEERSNCMWWTKPDGTRDGLENYYHGNTNDGSAAWCWMPRHNVIHPVTQCNDIMNQRCSLLLEQERLEAQVTPYHHAIEAAQSTVSATESTLQNLQANINHLNDEIDDPRFKVEPITTTFFIILSVAAIALLLGGTYAYRRPAKNYVEARIHNDDVNMAIKSLHPATATRIINLTLRLDIHELSGLKLQTLIDQLTEKVKELKLRREQVMAFFGGSLSTNLNASNREFLEADGQRDVTRKIFSYAFPKKP